MLPIALSIGDPAGIGPELVAEAWARRDSEGLPPFVAIGGAGLLATAARARGLDIAVQPVGSVAEAADVFTRALPVLGEEDTSYTPAEPTQDGARFALASLERAVALAASGDAGAVTTGPVAKSRLAEVGFDYPGQTEFCAAAGGVAAEDAVMMLAGPSLRAVPLTVHCALADVPRLVTAELIRKRAHVVHAALGRDFGIARPRIAIAALNPHAGEDGRMGTEERDTIIPVIERLRREGLDVTGPHPADAMFAPHQRGSYDAAIAMYHDQALVPLKALDFDSGVNVTLGLPFIRTSADHGTAFPIAGTGTARPGATIAAIRMAGEMAARRFHG
ncbi:4-hydroxythreonine-4-phosphate dehydrogenase PdxA [Paraurantiacibacter namhicola]|uniref:4-hydroxythreonine-4-phosphate dehydrogenase n=1 Tax=Paraurantiacibacter namhicola TaxID=645517 RepID=A0A1C7DAQ0_9SPHN|nr:4-hydroxythreonine-4-phosphate dehydrogenase PdxA [Paraurantiacibacter namhicola]ANU08391.1 4-hydroxythreonine-4-phosphate dehydrogenase [Paraurantiacibacter namhicola]